MDSPRRYRLRFALGAGVLVCLFALALSSLGPGRGDTVPAVPSPKELAFQTSGRDEVGDAPAWARKNAPQRDLLARSTPPEELADPAPTCGDPLVLVDRSHALPEHYAPGDLVSLPDQGVPTVGGGLMLRREASEHLRGLISAASADGEELVVASAFRSYDHQEFTHQRLQSIYGSGADATSARPGHSQHQLGTAVDFTNWVAAYQVQPVFGQTSAAWWLQDHAAEFGFVLAYPPGKNGTGYEFEPWHYRYIGVKNAGRLEKSGLALQEFLVREGVSPRC